MRASLNELHPGESGYVRAVRGKDEKLIRRLADMGVTPLTHIKVIKTAPMGDPIEIKLRGYFLSLRKEDAMAISLFTEDEAKLELELEKRRRHELEQSSAIHEPDNDIKAHETAAKLTDWAIASSVEGIRFPIPGADNLRREIDDCQSCGLCKKGKKQKKDCKEEKKPLKLALAGNPNSGKTTLFNALTGAKEYVGNWPGVTVEKKEGRFMVHGHEATLVDLPGIYSLSPYSMEEVIARNYIIKEEPDAIINIVDGTNLERNLYLTLQLIELERPLILAVNMIDEVERSGNSIDTHKLSLELGVPVVPISARTKEGVNELVRQCELIKALAHDQTHRGFLIEPDHIFDPATHAAHHEIGEIIGSAAQEAGFPKHWAQTKLLEEDEQVRAALKLSDERQRQLEQVLKRYTDPLFSGSARVADCRYRFITDIASKVITKPNAAKSDAVSGRLDDILTHKYLALPIFLLIMFAIFMLTFGSVGGWLSEQVEYLVGDVLSPMAQGYLKGAPEWLSSLICDGVINGVGGVLTFLPQIALLFLCLSILEDSGYLSRTAFIMDRPLRKLGLSGKSFIPMLMGFGCTVPAAMGARTMENEKDKRMTILLLPFMSCSAKLPIYGLIAGAFFQNHRGLIVFSLYMLGLCMGALSGLLLKDGVRVGRASPFVMEMPPYRKPSLKNTMLHVNERLKHFLEKAGTIILLMSIVLWVLQSFDMSLKPVIDVQESILARFGSLLSPLFKPLGMGEWQIVVALLTGFIAKEAVVSSLSLFYGFSAANDLAVKAALSGAFTPLSAYAFLVFVLLYVPCMAAVATISRELASIKWTVFMIVYQLAIAYVAALLVYNLGQLLGF